MLELYKIGDRVDTNKFIFETYEIEENDSIYKRIINKSYKKNDQVSIRDLIYIKLLHYNYNGEVVVGELIIHKAILKAVKNIFSELFDRHYQINSMRLIDDFFIDDNPVNADRNSIIHNNSSSFCYRNIPDTNNLSNHSLGIAIDINPYDNPYTPRNMDGSFDVSLLSDYEKSILKNRDELAKTNPHIITLEDVICKIFEKEQFECGGSWPLKSDKFACDWQHFEPNEEKIIEIKKKIEKIHNREREEII